MPLNSESASSTGSVQRNERLAVWDRDIHSAVAHYKLNIKENRPPSFLANHRLWHQVGLLEYRTLHTVRVSGAVWGLSGAVAGAEQ